MGEDIVVEEAHRPGASEGRRSFGSATKIGDGGGEGAGFHWTRGETHPRRRGSSRGAAEADAAQPRANISDVEAAAASREDRLRSEASAVEARLRATEEAIRDGRLVGINVDGFEGFEGGGGGGGVTMTMTTTTTEEIAALARQMEAAESSARAERASADAREAELTERVKKTRDLAELDPQRGKR